MSENLILYVATYADPDAAAADLAVLEQASSSGDVDVVGAVVAGRDADGAIVVSEHGKAAPVGRGTKIGAVGGLVLGLFAPPLLLSTALGAGIGAGIASLVKKHEEKELGVDLEEYLPLGSSAIVAVVHDQYLDRVEDALRKAERSISKAIDSGDYEKVDKAVRTAARRIEDSVER